jgi:hypothetical protein
MSALRVSHDEASKWMVPANGTFVFLAILTFYLTYVLYWFCFTFTLGLLDTCFKIILNLNLICGFYSVGILFYMVFVVHQFCVKLEKDTRTIDTDG